MPKLLCCAARHFRQNGQPLGTMAPYPSLKGLTAGNVQGLVHCELCIAQCPLIFTTHGQAKRGLIILIELEIFHVPTRDAEVIGAEHIHASFRRVEMP